MSRLSIREWLKQNKSNYANTKEAREQWIIDCSESLGFPLTSIKPKGYKIWPAKELNAFVFNGSNIEIIKPNDFISEIDVVKQVEIFLNDIVKDGYVECEKLRKKFDLSLPKWKELKRLNIFEKRQLTYIKGSGKRVAVWSSEKGIQLAKDTLSMSRYES